MRVFFRKTAVIFILSGRCRRKEGRLLFHGILENLLEGTNDGQMAAKNDYA